MFQRDALLAERIKHAAQRSLGDLKAALQGVFAIHQHFRFHHRHQPRLLA